VAFSDLLTHTGTILRRASGVDRFGQPKVNQLSGVGSFPCRLSAATGGESFTERSQDVIRAYYWLYYQMDVDLHEDDDVMVTDENGATILEKGNVIVIGHESDGTSPHHKKARVMAVRGSTA